MSVAPIEVVVVLECDPAHAFEAFVAGIGHWWPLGTHSLSHMAGLGPSRALRLEPGEGGRLIETDADGQEHIWGSVTAWDPPRALCLSWHVGRTSALATEVSVRFERTDDNRTGVTLIHSNWQILGDAGAPIRDRNANGWPTLLGHHYATYAQTRNLTGTAERTD